MAGAFHAHHFQPRITAETQPKSNHKNLNHELEAPNHKDLKLEGPNHKDHIHQNHKPQNHKSKNHKN